MLDLTDSQRAEIRSEMEFQTKKYHRQLKGNRNKIFAINLIRTLYGQIDAQAAQAITGRGVEFDCRPGCNYCCSLRVEVLPPEVFLMARTLRKLPKVELDALIDKLSTQATYAIDRRMEDFNMPCALLKDGRCSVYELRPSMCRKLYSLDVEACRTPGLDAPEDTTLFTKIAAITVGANEGYGRAGLPNYSHELTQALLVALKDEKAEDNWYGGAEVFPMLPARY